jgi:hypothetical protein
MSAPAFLIVDEAAEYFDENLETLLSQARKFQLGVLISHQHMDQLTPVLRSSVAANTSVKFAGGISDRDARGLAPDMKTSAEFISAQRKSAQSASFACYVRNFTENAISLTVPFGTIERQSVMTKAEHAELLARNRIRYGATTPKPTPTPPSSSTAKPAIVTVDTVTANSAAALPPVRPESTAGEDWRS